MEHARKDIRATAAMAAVVRVRTGPHRLREVGRERLVVDNARREKVGMHGVHQVEQVAVVGVGGVGVQHLARKAVSARGELHHVHVRLHERHVLRTDPRAADERLPLAPGVGGAAAEHAEVELRAHSALADAVVAVQVVMELLERALAQTAAVRLDAEYLPVRLGPGVQFFHVGEVAMALAARVERVEELVHVLEARRAVDAQVDAPADLHLREALSQDGGDERRGGRHDVGEEPAPVHVVERRLDEVRQLGADGDVAVAVAVEERVEQDAVLAAPAEVRVQPFPKLVRERRRRTAAQHARPREEHLADAREMGRARVHERFVVEMPDGQVLERMSHAPHYTTNGPPECATIVAA